MNQTLIFALFVMAMLIVVCVGYSASQAWRSLLVEQRLNQIKGATPDWYGGRICSL